MKKAIVLMCLGLAGFLFGGTVSAQSANSNNPQTNAVPQTGLPMQTVVKVLKEACPHFNVKLGTLMSGYVSGNCKVRQVGISGSGDGLYEVKFGGGVVIVEILADN